jgi:hypothetical protein
MASEGAKRQPETQNGAAVGLAQVAESLEVTWAFQSSGDGGVGQERWDSR